MDDDASEVGSLLTERSTPRPKSAPARRQNRTPRGPKGVPNSAFRRRAAKAETVQKTLQEYEVDLLRKYYLGNSVGTKPRVGESKSFTGLQQSQMMNVAYASTSHYLRQAIGVEKTRNFMMEQALTGRSTSRPIYKTQEEYYDEVIALKKQIQEVNKENSEFKRLIRRKEEEYIKKNREVEQLLDPTKSDDIRRTFADGKPDAGVVVHSLKQRILKLEQQFREKEAAYNKLQSDLKTTKMEEMKIHLETLFNEVVRLKNEKATSSEAITRRSQTPRKDNTQKIKSLTATILKMSVEKASLQAENKSLKIDLHKSLDTRELPPRRVKNGYDDHGKKDLLHTIARLEKEKADLLGDGSVDDRTSKRHNVEGKITLEGTLAQRLDQLDKRETELLQENKRQVTIIAKLKEDRSHYRAKCDELDRELKAVKKAAGIKDTGVRSNRSISPRDRDSGNRDSPRGTKSPREGLSRRNSRASSLSRVDPEQQRRVEEFQRNRAAKQIQRGWHHHRDDISDQDEAAEFITSALIGQKLRQKNIVRLKSGLSADVGRDSDSDAADVIQASLKGHQYLRHQLNNARSPPSPARRSSRPVNDYRGDGYSESSHRREAGHGSRSPGSPRTPRSTTGSGRNTPTGHRSGSPRPRTPLNNGRHDNDDDDDSDVVVSKGKSKIF